MKYKLTNDYEIVPVSSTGGARTQTMNEYLKMKREVEAYLKMENHRKREVFCLI